MTHRKTTPVRRKREEGGFDIGPSIKKDPGNSRYERERMGWKSKTGKRGLKTSL